MKSTPTHNPRIRRFVKEYKRGVEATNNNIKVQVHWASDYVDRQGLRDWFMCGLNRKINWNGNVRQDYRDDRINLRRDCEIYTTWTQRKQKTQWGLRFYTKYFKKRFPQVETQMKERFEDDF